MRTSRVTLPRRARLVALATPALVLLAALASAAPSVRVRLPEAPSRFVYDEAGALSSDERRVLEDTLMVYDRRGLEIGVAIFKSLQGDPIEDVSMALAEKWKPGSAERDNGALIVVGMEERSVRIEVGYGLEAVVNDAMAGRIIRNDIAPAFREGRYGLGLSRAVSSLARLARGETLPEPANAELPAWLPLVFILIFILVFISVSRRARRGWISRQGWTGGGWRGPYIGGGGFGGFGGGGSGGGGGSFGGGSFGGGGASGRW
ncbi:MAG TPA: TPM domain-containing protein [Candidatus Krumholzibacteria bacterium]|nr:TPM domain-containing protein [Candidatus Krumholzibacteria bacterium]